MNEHYNTIYKIKIRLGKRDSTFYIGTKKVRLLILD